MAEAMSKGKEKLISESNEFSINENFAQDPLAISISSGVDSSHENQLLGNVGEITHALSSLNPCDQADTYFVLEIHHRGYFDNVPQKGYFGGTIQYMKDIDSDRMSYVEMVDIMRDFGEPDTYKMYHLLPNADFDGGLRELKSDNDVSDMFAIHNGRQIISIYVESPSITISTEVNGVIDVEEDNDESKGERINDISSDQESFSDGDLEYFADGDIFYSFSDGDLEYFADGDIFYSFSDGDLEYFADGDIFYDGIEGLSGHDENTNGKGAIQVNVGNMSGIGNGEGPSMKAGSVRGYGNGEGRSSIPNVDEPDFDDFSIPINSSDDVKQEEFPEFNEDTDIEHPDFEVGTMFSSGKIDYLRLRPKNASVVIREERDRNLISFNMDTNMGEATSKGKEKLISESNEFCINEMESLPQDLFTSNISSGAGPSHENHLLGYAGEITIALQSPNPFDQAEASSSSSNSFSSERENAIDGDVIQMEGSCRRFSLHVVQKATNDFDDALLIGTGGFGKVYTGVINDGITSTVAAIKQLNNKSKQGAEEFWAEVNLFSKLWHSHVVLLIGYCYEHPEMILVHEYMARQDLSKHLYKRRGEECSESIPHLTWEQRLNICLGAARGLDYLHKGTEQGFIHGDVKSSNILLDENWVAKVCDFGLSQTISIHESHVSTSVKGTFGYIDPEYFLTGRLTKKSDVYSFGVVLLEVLCGRPPIDTRLEEEQVSLVRWAKEHLERGKLDEIIDPSLNGEITPHNLKYFVVLADKCLHQHPNGRPTMAEVAESLEIALASHKRKERPTMAEVAESLEIALASHKRKERSGKTTVKTFQGIKHALIGKNSWWRERTGNGSNHSEGPSNHSEPISDNVAQSVYTPFSLAEIRAATNDFDEGLLIDGDSFVRLYKGFMVGGTLVVAIKRYQSTTKLNFTELFGAKIPVRSLNRHPNIVSLIGFCNEEHELILVYDCTVNRTLNSYLLEINNNPLLWKKRLQICIDFARGLEYLHTNVELRFIYRNIKPSNVFLDDKGVAKFCAFELSAPMPTTTVTLQTALCCMLAYTDPDYFIYGTVTKKSVVYTFGVMLLEILCAKKPYAHVPKTDEDSLLPCFKGCIKRGTIEMVIDPYLTGRIAPECFRHYVNTALSCLVKESIRRPSMNDVLGSLQSSLQLQEAWENSFQMGMAFFPSSYNDTISVDGEFTIGEQSFLISDLVRSWGDISPSVLE